MRCAFSLPAPAHVAQARHDYRDERREQRQLEREHGGRTTGRRRGSNNGITGDPSDQMLEERRPTGRVMPSPLRRANLRRLEAKVAALSLRRSQLTLAAKLCLLGIVIEDLPEIMVLAFDFALSHFAKRPASFLQCAIQHDPVCSSVVATATPRSRSDLPCRGRKDLRWMLILSSFMTHLRWMLIHSWPAGDVDDG